jgi:pimeloyl-ACP methyl ester carboxylesterase
MPFVTVSGVRLAYQRAGAGEPVLLIMGSGASGRVWTTYQTPALHQAGYETIVFDNRGIAPSDVPPGPYRLADLVADTQGLIEALGIAPCRIVATSLGSLVAQELGIEHPGLVKCVVLLATRARADTTRRALADAAFARWESGGKPPVRSEAVRQMVEMLSPATLRDDVAAGHWLDLFERAVCLPGKRQPPVLDSDGDRRAALHRITAPSRVVAFADDLITPPHLAAEVADAIPDCDLVLIEDCGHLGHLEHPKEVNTAITEFLSKH